MFKGMKSKDQKKREKERDTLEETYSRNSSLPKIMFVVFAIAVVIGFFMYNKYIMSKRIEVVKLSHNVTSGDIVTVDSCFKKHDMLYSAYVEEGLMQVRQPDGTFKEQQGIVLWKDREDYKDWRFNSYQQEDSIFTLNSASEKMQYKNPFLEAMEIGNEEYVLDIESNGIDVHQLFPGTALRMRVAFEVPKELEEECRKAVERKKEYDGTSAVLKVLSENGYIVGATGAEGDKQESFEGGGGAKEKDARTAMISEVIFDKIEAVDMFSNSQESIFEIYMSLLRMPLVERAPYLQTSFEEDISGQFRARITPKSLALDVTREEANSLHEFEVMKYNTKWTIIKTASSSDMLKDFIEISDQVKVAGNIG